jgi:hypothetical protein
VAERSDLVLRARVVLLRNSLWRVNNALKDLGTGRPNPFDDIRAKVHDDARAARDALQQLSSPAQELVTAQNALNAIIADTTPPAPESTAGASSQVLSMLQSEAARTIRDELDHGFKQRTRELEKVQQTADAAANTHGTQREELDREAWRLFTECVGKCQELFAEYLDLVRGVLVRDAGLDRDLFRIADDLVRRTTIKEYRWESLTIPASRERRHMTAARLIRIGFPEWTVWMVPLAAGELGFIFADRYPDVDTEVIDAAFDDVVAGRAGIEEGEPPIDKTELRAWVADAFATCVTGPAYVWAAMLLRADPASAVDQRRVAVMVDVLELLASELYDPGGNFVEVADRTRTYWRVAVAQANTGQGPGEPSWVAEARRTVAAAVFDRVRSPLTADRWPVAAGLADRFLELPSVESIAGELHHGQLAEVLLAGWMARVRLARAGATDDLLRKLERLVRLTSIALIDSEHAAPKDGSNTARGANATVLAEAKPAPGGAGLGEEP